MLRHLLARFGQRTIVRFSSLACRSLPDKKLPSYKLLMPAFPCLTKKHLITSRLAIRFILNCMMSMLCFFRLNPKMFSTHHCLTLSVEPWLIDTF